MTEPGKTTTQKLTEEKLLEMALAEMTPTEVNFHLGNKSPELQQLVHKYYKKPKKFIDKVTAESKFRKCRAKWPVGWWEHIDPTPVLERLGQRLSAQDKELLLRLCDTARQTKAPPEMTANEKKRINTFDSPGRILNKMGIPYIQNPGTLKRMLKYWETGT